MAWKQEIEQAIIIKRISPKNKASKMKEKFHKHAKRLEQRCIGAI